jgi:2-amino-4-hydroxy-6-hydroxymethyldihydropteridine diphosphokinase
MKGKYLLLGTNQGDKINNLLLALQFIQRKIGRTVRQSAVYESEAWGYRPQPSFYNMVVEVRTSFQPSELLRKIKQIEREMGRTKRDKWRERIIDIDILYYDDEIIHSKELSIPHPEIPNRRFTLVPLCEISGSAIHPVLGRSNQELLAETADPLKVEKAADQVRL